MSRYVLLAVVAGVVGSIIAGRKGCNQIGWFILCACFPVLIIVIALLPSKRTQKCPYCARLIEEDAKFCKHCGKEQPIEVVRVS